MRAVALFAFGLLLSPPVVAHAAPTVAIETSMGTITVELDRGRAPKTVDNFLR